MITLTETLAVDTVDAFLTAGEVARLAEAVERHIVRTGWQPSYVGEELRELPDEVQDVLDAATRRHLPEIRRTFPAVTGVSPWQLIQFGPGEGAVRHMDGIAADPFGTPRHVARIGVTVEDAREGGEFFFETTSSEGVWDTRHDGTSAPGYAEGMRFTRIAPHDRISRDEPDTAWIHEVRGVPWTTPAGAGTGIVYGAQLIHGITPVVSGRCRKFITGLVAG
ncbi:hypothetical protein [Streptomyces caatingaensis]|uniref:Fe2OG dioxygenase domain-containing protein n=1 Tax=Streptomyces caatingaensis TaxID=1678637 RepID=A0A0K9XLV0_9ACTN|nr:hypothetical protein [Streptomyces caatingaensis]KNB54223.1 hypothetical protein AC230_03595 [Streptomyces caatingaensis]